MDKENSTAYKLPLTNANNNSQYQTPKANSKNTKQDQLLSVLEDELSNNKRCDLINVILADPLLKELNTSL
jgi:predicted choloylglycine hydrolase